MTLETTDGVALLGYAGLGATAKGTEPGDWMNAVLRGRNVPLEAALGFLARAMESQFPRHLLQIPENNTAAHSIIVPAFVGGERRLYSIDMAFAHDRQSYKFRYTRHVLGITIDVPSKPPQPIGLGGTGGLFLINERERLRNLLRIIKSHDRRNVPPHVVADCFANLNYYVHQALPDGSVGARCIVAWRYRKDGVLGGGGGHQFYTESKRDGMSSFLPNIVHGRDMTALVNVFLPGFRKAAEAMLAGKTLQEQKTDEINAELAQLPDKPDERLV
jgi:hypothetical protein